MIVDSQTFTSEGHFRAVFFGQSFGHVFKCSGLRLGLTYLGESTTHTGYSISIGSRNATYYCDANGSLDVDLSDIIATMYTGSVTISVSGEGGSITNTFALHDGHNAYMLHHMPTVELYGSDSGHVWNFLPPSKVYRSSQFDDPIVSAYAPDGVSFGGQISQVGYQNYKLTGAFYTITVGEKTYNRRVDEIPCGAMAVCLDYRQLVCPAQYTTPPFRRQIWLVKEKATSATDVQTLLSPISGTEQAKGHEDTYTLYIDGLSASDIDYYSDIILSTEVYMYFETIYGNRSKDLLVRVVDSSVTIPSNQRESNGSLTIKVKTRADASYHF